MCKSIFLALILSISLSAQTTPQTKKSPLPPNVSESWYAQVSREIAQSEYHYSKQTNIPIKGITQAWQAPNRAQGLRSIFDGESFYLTPQSKERGQWHWGLKLVSADSKKPDRASISVKENRIEYHRGKITEWYINSKNGVEQGFTLHKPISKNRETTLELELLGDLKASYNQQKEQLQLQTQSGVQVLAFGKFKAYDANNKTLEGGMKIKNGRLILWADTTDAAYPVTIDPLATTASWTAESDQADAKFGTSVASAGDVNGDGFSDVIIGAPFYDNGQDNEGRAFVYHGSASGLSAAANWTAESDQADANFGWSVATAGDINGDGYADVIIGARYYDNGQDGEGRAFVYHGSASGLSATANWTAESNQADANFGKSVATAGDINGDGYADVIIGAPSPPLS